MKGRPPFTDAGPVFATDGIITGELTAAEPKQSWFVMHAPLPMWSEPKSADLWKATRELNSVLPPGSVAHVDILQDIDWTKLLGEMVLKSAVRAAEDTINRFGMKIVGEMETWFCGDELVAQWEAAQQGLVDLLQDVYMVLSCGEECGWLMRTMDAVLDGDDIYHGAEIEVESC